MSYPATARIVPISEISESNLGEKFRLFGILVLPEDPTSNIARLHSLTAGSKGTSRRRERGDANLGLLVDMSLCMDDGIAALKETASVVMVMGTLEENTPIEVTKSPSHLVNGSIILRAILMTDANDVNLVEMEAAITQRRKFELSS